MLKNIRHRLHSEMRFYMFVSCVVVHQEEKDPQWKRAMDYLSAVSELNYMTQIVIMLYEDNNKVPFSPSLPLK